MNYMKRKSNEKKELGKKGAHSTSKSLLREHLLGYTQTPTVFGSIHSKNFPLQVFNPKEILKKFCEKSPNFFSLFFALCVFSLLLSGVATKAVMAASAASEATAAQAEAEAAVAAFTLLSSSFSRL